MGRSCQRFDHGTVNLRRVDLGLGQIGADAAKLLGSRRDTLVLRNVVADTAGHATPALTTLRLSGQVLDFHGWLPCARYFAVTFTEASGQLYPPPRQAVSCTRQLHLYDAERFASIAHIACVDRILDLQWWQEEPEPRLVALLAHYDAPGHQLHRRVATFPLARLPPPTVMAPAGGPDVAADSAGADRPTVLWSKS